MVRLRCAALVSMGVCARAFVPACGPGSTDLPLSRYNAAASPATAGTTRCRRAGHVRDRWGGCCRRLCTAAAAAAEPERPQKALPVTVLSGFLGAGKTTLLQRILANTQGLRVAVIVNDMAEVNIDAKLVRGGGGGGATSDPSSPAVAGSEVHRVAERLVEMQNGCICCTLREDLLEAVAGLAAEGRFDHCVIESTGISEPIHVAETFTFETEGGASLGDMAPLDTMVTVVDAANFMRELEAADALGERGLAPEGIDDERTISELMMSQVEFADVVLLNKVDAVAPAAVAELEALLRGLNPDARLLRCVRCDVDVREVLGTGRFDFERAAEAPGWLKALNGDHVHTPETEEFGITSFVYRARRPLHPARALRFVTAHLPAVARSKGFFWLATRNSDMGVWSQAGGSFVGEAGGAWWAATPREEWPDDAEERAFIEADFEPPWGDRRQELVFIGGRAMDAAALRAALDGALLTDAEMALGPAAWEEQFEDDFPPWEIVSAAELEQRSGEARAAAGAGAGAAAAASA